MQNLRCATFQVFGSLCPLSLSPRDVDMIYLHHSVDLHKSSWIYVSFIAPPGRWAPTPLGMVAAREVAPKSCSFIKKKIGVKFSAPKIDFGDVMNF